jgi:hypothetical protein
MSAASPKRSYGNPVFDNPGWSAMVITLIILAGFLFAVYQVAMDAKHHGGGTEGPHGAQPAAEHH